METSVTETEVVNHFAENLAKAMELIGRNDDCQFVAADLRTGEIVDHDSSREQLNTRIRSTYGARNELCYITIIDGVDENRTTTSQGR